MQNFEVVPFIPITILILILTIIVSIKWIGPIAEFPKDKECEARNSGLAIFSYICGAVILLMQIRTIITLFTKPYVDFNYLIASNRLLFTIFIIITSLWLMREVFLGISKWQLGIVIIGSICVYISLTIALEILALGIEDFMIFGAVILILFGLGAMLLNSIGIKRLKGKIENLFIPLFIPSEKSIKQYASVKPVLIFWIITGIMFYLSWADLPLF
jgi:hypothetical protein